MHIESTNGTLAGPRLEARSANNSAVKALMVLTQSEVDDFFGPNQTRELRTLLPNLTILISRTFNSDDWQTILSKYEPEILITGWTTPPMDVSLLPILVKTVRYICNISGLVRRLIPREFTQSRIIITNWGNSISHSVAECALMHILCCLRRVADYTVTLHCEKGWNGPEDLAKNRGLFGRKVGLHGFGNVARELVKLLQPFNVKISAYSEGVPPIDFRSRGVSELNSLEELFSWSDVLVELEGATPQLEGVVDERLLRKLPHDAVFINLGRGRLVDEVGLLKVVREGRIRVGLDVFLEEPLPADSGFRGLKNVFLTPHIGGPTRDRIRECGKLALMNIERYLSGCEPEFQITPVVYDRMT